jgi:hypothetical protein
MYVMVCSVLFYPGASEWAQSFAVDDLGPSSVRDGGTIRPATTTTVTSANDPHYLLSFLRRIMRRVAIRLLSESRGTTKKVTCPTTSAVFDANWAPCPTTRQRRRWMQKNIAHISVVTHFRNKNKPNSAICSSAWISASRLPRDRASRDDDGDVDDDDDDDGNDDDAGGMFGAWCGTSNGLFVQEDTGLGCRIVGHLPVSLFDMF